MRSILISSNRAFSKTMRSGGMQGESLGDSFNFPKHKDYFNDMFYEEEDSKSPFE